MKIINKTHWKTEHLQAFVSRAAQEELTPEKRKQVIVTFTYTRHDGSSYSSGHAYLGGKNARIRLSKHNPDKVDLAHVIVHELAHLRGMTHSAMRDDPHYRRVGRWREIHAWGNDLPLEVQERKKKSRPGAEQKLAVCQANLARNETKLKRITTIVKKWRSKVRYYERQIRIAAERGNAE